MCSQFQPISKQCTILCCESSDAVDVVAIMKRMNACMPRRSREQLFANCYYENRSYDTGLSADMTKT